MRRSGLWHPRLAAVVAGLRHTETIVVADPGLPVPPEVETIDLVWARDEPALLPVLAVLTAELVAEEALIAEELTDAVLLRGLDRCLGSIPLKRTSHEDFKLLCRRSRAVVRTGETTPYANVILTAGVPF
ncbi:D-ribose pyranase [Kribbella sp. NPDC051586]|uniref:D-ribose pyranase n=1 Tax=Kribbella sp. NPDC051586 TaxID=3364118 RepID=UPI0037B2C6AC